MVCSQPRPATSAAEAKGGRGAAERRSRYAGDGLCFTQLTSGSAGTTFLLQGPLRVVHRFHWDLAALIGRHAATPRPANCPIRKGLTSPGSSLALSLSLSFPLPKSCVLSVAPLTQQRGRREGIPTPESLSATSNDREPPNGLRLPQTGSSRYPSFCQPLPAGLTTTWLMKPRHESLRARY